MLQEPLHSDTSSLMRMNSSLSNPSSGPAILSDGLIQDSRAEVRDGKSRAMALEARMCGKLV